MTFFFSLYKPIILGHEDTLTAKISGPYARGDAKRLRQIILEALSSFTIFFLVFVALPALFVSKLFALMHVHQNIAADINLSILLFLPSMYLIGICETLKGFLINFGEIDLAGLTSVLASMVGIAGCVFFILVLKLGSMGVILSMLLFALGSFGLNMANYWRVVVPHLENMEKESSIGGEGSEERLD